MQLQSPFFAGVILTLVKIFATSNGIENSILLPESMEVDSAKSQVNCSSEFGAGYQCVKIEDCKTMRRSFGGSASKLCKSGDGKPTHICCQENSVKDSTESTQKRRKRYDPDSIYFDDDYRISSWFDRDRHDHDHDQDDEDWSEEDYGWDTTQRNIEKNVHSRFGRDHHHPYDDDVETFDVRSRHSFSDDEPECGILEEEMREKILAPALGGSPVKTAALTPWMVAVGHSRNNEKPQWFCGGALISRNIVITAAHCLTKRKANLIRVGELDLTSDTDLAEPQDSEIEATIIHPEYRLPRHYHDIAILKLKTPVKYTKYVRPICLPTDKKNLYENAEVTLTGWGTVEYGGERSPILQEVRITVISNSECNSKYGDPTTVRDNARTLPRGIIDSELCAGDKNGGRDACQGDSGGPIVKMEGRRRVVVGLVSSGLGCGSKFFPGIYTRVSYYSDWIRSFL